MKTSLVKLSLLAAIGCTLTFCPVQSLAQEKKNENAAEKSGGAQGESKKATNPNRAIPFRGKVESVDKAANTVKVGARVFVVTAETKIQKDGKPAKLDDVAVGEAVRGSYRQSEDGKLNAVSLFLGVKEAEPKAEGAKSAVTEEQVSKRTKAGSKGNVAE